MMLRILFGLLALGLAGTAAVAGGEIYGTVTTVDGEVFTGPIRWDRNENYWNDILDAAKEKTEQVPEEGGVTVYLFGRKLFEIEESGSGSRRNFSIPFGHIRSIVPDRGSKVEITLRSGETILVREGGTDLGRSIRGGIVVYDAKHGKGEIDWLDVERIDFSAGPGKGRDEQRLFGEVETSAGTFAGFIVWDLDESLLGDVLDGEENGRDREIHFRDIARIERLGDRRSRVVLSDGSEMVLDGTNDVNRDNRGIVVTLPGIGRVTIRWDEFEKVRFAPAPASPGFDQFDGGRRLSGTLTTPEGDTYSGEIVWDRDESYTWEELDGEVDDIEYAILFAHIESIRRASDRSAEVKLRNGDTLILSRSNDVNSSNAGIIVRPPAGEEMVFDWDEFEKVEFSGS